MRKAPSPLANSDGKRPRPSQQQKRGLDPFGRAFDVRIRLAVEEKHKEEGQDADRHDEGGEFEKGPSCRQGQYPGIEILEEAEIEGGASRGDGNGFRDFEEDA
jgi:hypothetical protein